VLECPVCEFVGLDEKPYDTWPPAEGVPIAPPYEDWLGSPSYEVCPLCGFEFGNDDNPGTADPLSFAEYRAEWEEQGRPIFSVKDVEGAAGTRGPMPDDRTDRPDWAVRIPHLCPICGFGGLREPSRTEDNGGSYEICASCGFQFGVTDDDGGYTYEAWRARWIEMGLPWTSVGIAVPAHWDPSAQLQRVVLKLEWDREFPDG
jgi:hypothetical protein